MRQQQDLVSKICQSFSLPLYALVHDSLIQALQSADTDQQTSASIIHALPKLSLKSNEYEELKNAKGKLELQDSFGSGSFYLVDGGNQQAFVLTEQKSADYLNQLSENENGQGNPNTQSGESQQQGGQEQSHNGQGQSNSQNGQNQDGNNQQQNQLHNVQQQAAAQVNEQQNQTQNKDQFGGQNLQQQLQMLSLVQGQSEDKILQQLALMQMMQGNNSGKSLVNDYQKLMLMQQLSQQTQNQGQQSNEQNQGKSMQSQSQQQGDLLKLLEQMQMLNALQGKQH